MLIYLQKGTGEALCLSCFFCIHYKLGFIRIISTCNVPECGCPAHIKSPKRQHLANRRVLRPRPVSFRTAKMTVLTNRRVLGPRISLFRTAKMSDLTNRRVLGPRIGLFRTAKMSDLTNRRVLRGHVHMVGQNGRELDKPRFDN